MFPILPCIDDDGNKYAEFSVTVDSIPGFITPNWFNFYSMPILDSNAKSILGLDSNSIIDKLKDIDLRYGAIEITPNSDYPNELNERCITTRSPIALFLNTKIDENTTNNIIVVDKALGATIKCTNSDAFNCLNYGINSDPVNGSFHTIYGIIGYYAMLIHEFTHMEQMKNASIAIRAVKGNNEPYQYGEIMNVSDWINPREHPTDSSYSKYVDIDSTGGFNQIACDLNRNGRYHTEIIPGNKIYDYSAITNNNLVSFKLNPFYTCITGYIDGDVMFPIIQDVKLFEGINSTNGLCGYHQCIIYEVDIENLDADRDFLPNIFDSGSIYAASIPNIYEWTDIRFNPESEAYYKQNNLIQNYFNNNLPELDDIEEKLNKGDW